jgi:hypothetical protein
MPPGQAAKSDRLLFSIFALLVGHAAAGLASRLTGSLALTAAAVLCTFAQIAGFESLDSFHDSFLPFIDILPASQY